jgi:hypothetical protein
MSDEPLPSENLPKGRALQRLDERQAKALRESAASPLPDQLRPVATSGVFKPLGVNGVHRDKSGWTFTTHFQVQASDIDEFRAKLRKAVAKVGFEISEYGWPRVGFEDVATGRVVTGVAFAERNLMNDPLATRRKNRIRWVGVVVGLAMFVAGVVRFPYVMNDSPFQAVLFILGALVAVFSALSAANRDFWSELAVIRWRSTTPVPHLRVRQPPITLNTPVQMAITVGRGLSQEWRGKNMGGRTILTLYQMDDSIRLQQTIGLAEGGKLSTE